MSPRLFLREQESRSHLQHFRPRGTEIDGKVLQNIIGWGVAGDHIEDVVGRQC